jgi:hypothetical protein
MVEHLHGCAQAASMQKNPQQLKAFSSSAPHCPSPILLLWTSMSSAENRPERVKWPMVWRYEFHDSRVDTNQWNVEDTSCVHNNA